jgi:RND family efflux transporter MFP subunit
MGNIQSRQAIKISTMVVGRVLRIYVREGQRVEKGELLVNVDASEARSQYEQAKGKLRAADVALHNAELDYARFAALYREAAVPLTQLEQKEVAQAEARAQRAQVAATLRAARTMLTYGRILAPDAGIITKKWVDEGNLAYPGTPILTLENPRELELEVAVPEGRAGLLRPGQQATLTVDSPPLTLEVPITAVVEVADPMSRTSTVKLAMPAAPALKPGQFAQVRFEAQSAPALAVPLAALVVQGQMEGLFVAQDGLARLRWVQTGQHTDTHVQVIAGLEPGELVIWPVPAGLEDGTPVEVIP